MTNPTDTITDCPACNPHFCPRCLEPNKITHRAISDEMDMKVCFNCALEAWKYLGPEGRIKLEVVYDRGEIGNDHS